ncbi:MAG: hypothetical protein AB7S36_13160, partial [Planctomycetota bacterium]
NASLDWTSAMLRPGSYQREVRSATRATERRMVTIEAGKPVTLDIAMYREARLTVKIELPDGESVPGGYMASVRVLVAKDPASAHDMQLTPVDDQLTIPGMRVGVDYTVSVWLYGYQPTVFDWHAVADAPARTIKPVRGPDNEDVGAAYDLLGNKDFTGAEAAFLALAEKFPANPDLDYHLGCCYSQWGDSLDGDARAAKFDQAFARLTAAVEKGWASLEHTKRDTDLAPLHSDPRFQKLIESIGK